ncbi:MAG: hypothetical protein IKN04_18980, partial [Clostridia bacterium]|nr:hypothetical protein [Clostridia bacterium]
THIFRPEIDRGSGMAAPRRRTRRRLRIIDEGAAAPSYFPGGLCRQSERIGTFRPVLLFMCVMYYAGFYESFAGCTVLSRQMLCHTARNPAKRAKKHEYGKTACFLRGFRL